MKGPDTSKRPKKKVVQRHASLCLIDVHWISVWKLMTDARYEVRASSLAAFFSEVEYVKVLLISKALTAILAWYRLGVD
jgi:hypothetical protein